MSASSADPTKVAVTKNVIFLMPFEAANPNRNRLFRLIYRRLKYIIEEKINKVSPLVVDGRECRFKVGVFLALAGNIARDALLAIRDCEIAISYVCDPNVTVVYELAVRNLLRAELVLIVDGDPASLLPYYMRDLGHIQLSGSWIDDPLLKQVAGREDVQSAADFEAAPTPDLIKAYSDANDGGVEHDLRRALQSVLSEGFDRPPHVVRVMEQHDPESLVSQSNFYYPAALLKYTWLPRRRSANGRYLPLTGDELSGRPVMCDWNPKFLELFGLAHWDREEPMDFDNLYSSLLDGIVDKANREVFLKDQEDLELRVAFGPMLGLAKVPVRFNASHPDPRYRDRSFLPCFVMKKRVGSPDMTHFLYILMLFFEVTGAADYNAYQFDAPEESDPPGH